MALAASTMVRPMPADGGDYIAELSTGGGLFRDWTSVMVRCEWDAPVREFAFTAAGPMSSKVEVGQPCKISLCGQQIISGYINCRMPSYDAGSHIVVLQGMSETSPIIRSSAPPDGVFTKTNFPAIARKLLQPYGLQLKIEGAPAGLEKEIKRFVVRPGETVWAAIERLGRMRGVVFSDDETGKNLVVREDMGAGSSAGADLVEGVNILGAHGVFRDDNVFSKIKAVGSIKGDDNFWPTRDVSASRTGGPGLPAVQKVLVAEHAADRDDAKQRVDAEAARDAWTSLGVVIVVQGWTTNGRPKGQLWELTKHVTVRSPMLFNHSRPVVLGTRALTFAQDARRGTTTTLELILPQYLSARKESGVSGPQGDILAPEEKPAQPDPPDTQQRGQGQYPPGGA